MVGKGAAKIGVPPYTCRIPGGAWAHLGDQNSEYLVEEGAPGDYWASNRSGQWGVEVGATSAPGRETANPVSCPLVVSSKGSVPSFGLYQILWASTENVDRGSCKSRECRLLGWSSSIPATLCREGTNDCDLSRLRRRLLRESSHISFSGERRCPGDSDSLPQIFENKKFPTEAKL